MVSLDKPIVLHYEGSIFSHRVLWYLWLRGIPYDECVHHFRLFQLRQLRSHLDPADIHAA